MKVRTAARVILCTVGLMAAAQNTERPEEIVRQATGLLRRTEGDLPFSKLRSTLCLAVLLERTAAEVRENGWPGVVSCRSGRGWSEPAILTAKKEEGSNASFEALILGTMDVDGALKLRAGNLDLAHQENVWAYTVSRGSSSSFGSFGSLKGLKPQVVLHERSEVPVVLEKNDAANHAVYGEKSSYEAVLKGEAGGSQTGKAFVDQLREDILTAGYGATGGGGGGGAVASAPPPPKAAPPPTQAAAPPPPPPPTQAAPPPPETAAADSNAQSAASSSPTASTGSSQAAAGSSAPATRRITGIAFLRTGAREASGYRLYSYVLIGHRPAEAERPRYEAFFEALLERTWAGSLLGAGVPKRRINLTQMLVTTTPDQNRFAELSTQEQADWVLDHYDYGRSAAILACLPQRIGYGPALVALLVPVDISTTPHPVLTLDLSSAQPAIMSSYVQYFVDQTSRDRFWDERALEALSLQLRNLMEVAASGLGLSRDAVESWLKLSK